MQIRVPHTIGDVHMVDRTLGVGCEIRCVQAHCGRKREGTRGVEAYENVSGKS